jgi:glutathione S-transferase
MHLSAKPIILYDIASVTSKSWSPNTLKTRLCLNYRGLNYTTEWLEYPDIATVSKEKGMLPTLTLQGQPLYTLPAILDPRDDGSPKALAESFEIAKYLDAAYPDEAKRLVPPGADAEQFQQDVALAVRSWTIAPLAPVLFPRAGHLLNPVSKEYYDRVKAIQYFNKNNLSEVKVTKEEEEKMWAASRDGWSRLDEEYYAKTDDKGPWLLGDKPSFGDFVVLAALIFFRQTVGEDGEEWKMMRGFNGGRWARLYDDTAYLRQSEI